MKSHTKRNEAKGQFEKLKLADLKPIEQGQLTKVVGGGHGCVTLVE